ncbi:MAG: hypothetical protein ONA69_08910 [candidate division KSB1 bacterium]|nr:hypothetical protein [candidate division KSB1 bacterium]MDZ7346896.1 hypothetical protein [candidate division KSB1 bacterium]
MNLKKRNRRLLWAILFQCLLTAPVNADAAFIVENMGSFVYPGSRGDEEAGLRLTEAEKNKFPNAKVTVVSRLTADPFARVVQHYRALCNAPSMEKNRYCRFEFSRINDQPASRIEIFSENITKLADDLRPTRINLFFVQDASASADPNKEMEIFRMLKRRLGVYCYPNAIPVEKYAERERKTYDADTEVYVLDTTDDFDKVHQHFRRLAGPFYVRMSMDGNIWMRDFEIDISRALSLEEFDKKVVLMVEENPLVPNARGALRPLRGHVFLIYYIWKRSPEELKELRQNSDRQNAP